ncbi:alpha-2-macroglobulin family protein [Marinimicrobium sp. C2-29]|uniref:alpha-2-macroglobulin family protein n=1 Tax=Marinimicrobium sp. C2-29 TaxID=3139825 RepID=UPI0031397F8E
MTGLLLLLLSAAALLGSGCQHRGEDATGTLTVNETRALLESLPPLQEAPEDRQAFQRRPESQPPPPPGEILQSAFPPPATDRDPPTETAEAPRLTRFAPEGELESASLVSLTFSTPMVALSAHSEQLTEKPPVTITPAVEGDWRWVDTRTLVFEPEAGRFPMATEYTVEVDGAFASAAGLPLGEDTDWHFATPPLQIEQTHPGADEPVSRQPVLVLVFNQPIDPETLLPFIELTAKGERYSLEVASDQQIAGDRNGASDRIDSLPSGHWLALRPTTPLPRASKAELTLAAGAPAVEGARKAPRAQSRAISIAAPLEVTETQCNWNNEPCRPGDSWSIILNNPLTDDWSEEQLSIEPALPDANIWQHENRISIQGSTEPATDYTVTLKAGTQDRFGQSLSEDVTLSFEVKNHFPLLEVPGNDLLVLSGETLLELPVVTRNINQFDVEIRRVEPKDWSSFVRYQQQIRRRGLNPPSDEEKASKPGTLIEQYTKTVPGELNTLVQNRLPLRDALNEQGLGHLVILISAPDPETEVPQRHRYRHASKALWVQVTNLGLSAQLDQQQALVWTTDLNRGTPLSDVSVTLGETSASTDSEGMASLALIEKEIEDPLLVARQEQDAAFLPLGRHSGTWSSSWYSSREKGYRYPTLIFDDRGLYRPGETARIKGIVRELTPGPQGDIHLPDDVTQLEWRFHDSQRNELARGRETVGESGAFEVTLPIPPTASLGRAALVVDLISNDNTVDRGEHYHEIQIEEFRRPEYEVTTALPTEPYIAGTDLEASVSARYYAGGPLPNAEVNWQVSLHTGHYSPPDWDGYTFGHWQPYWLRSHFYDEEQWRQSLSGQTDENGQHHLPIVPNAELEFEPMVYPHRLVTEASVTDVNRQQWASTSELLIHPANAYIGVKPESLFAQKGEMIELDLMVVDIQGNPLPDQKAEVTAEHMKRHDGDWQPTSKQTCTFTSGKSDKKVQQCQFNTEQAGKYRLTAQVTDSEGRRNQTRMDLWVSGERPDAPPIDDADQEEIRLIPDRERYAPGDTASIQITTPFAPAEALVTVRRQGIASYERIRLEDGTHTLEVPIAEHSIPKLVVDVEAVGQIDSRPVQSQGRLDLPVSSESRELDVALTLESAQLKPGEQARVQIEVKDHQGAAVDAGEVTLYAVDESVLTLAGYQLPLPLPIFYGFIEEGVVDYRLRDNLRVVEQTPPPERLEEMVALGSSDIVTRYEASERGSPSGKSSTASMRTDFDALATYSASIDLGDDGRAEAAFTLPDNLTRYRVMAVVHREQQFGTGETELEVGLPLMVRPSLPRFLNLGDTVELPVVVQNTTAQPMTVELALRASNLELTDAAGRRLTVPANDRREVRFSARPESAGTARLQVIAQSDNLQDAAELEIPVLTPATTEAFAQYGSLTEGADFHPVSVPGNVYPDFGGLNLSTSSTQFQSLTDAYRYLLDYPYGCTEQLASRLMSIAALGDLMTAFAGDEMPSGETIKTRVKDILTRMAKLQNADGGWGFWRASENSQAYVSVHATHALLRARDAGYAVDDEMLKRAIQYLSDLNQQLPDGLDSRQQHAVLAYGFYVQTLAGNPQPKAAQQLFDNAKEDELSTETLGWLLSVTHDAPDTTEMRAEIERRLNNRVRETAATAQFVEDYPEGGHWVLHGARRTDAVVLDALLRTDPDQTLVEKLARGLLNQRHKGHWGNTQENVFVLQALKHYFHQREAEEPQLTARAWLGDLFLGEHEYQGRTTETNAIEVPMQHLLKGPKNPTLALQHQGTGRLYYRLGLRYAPDDLQLDAASHGFRVKREYEAINRDDDVRKGSDGVWEIRAGAAVRVKLTLTAPARRHHVALADYLPAGLEPMNPNLEGTASVEPSRAVEGRTRYWQPHWYNHQQMRDERVEVFATQLEGGVYQYEYTALATTPGEFIAPPAKAEEMYQPETFGRSPTETVRIMEKQ